jgi:hypothetical protein
MSSTRRTSQPSSGASVPVGRRVPAQLAYSTEAQSHGLVEKHALIRARVMAVCALPKFLLTLLRRRRRLPKMAAYPSSLSL